MPTREEDPADEPLTFSEALDEVSEAVESGAGMPSVARATSRALDASVVVLDAASNVLAVACLSSEDERAVLAGERGSESLALRVADQRVGELRIRARADGADPSLRRIVATLIAQEVDRARAPERASEEAIGDFLGDLLARRLTDRQNIAARSGELGCDLSAGGSVIVARARPKHAVSGQWRARLLTVAWRGARGIERTSLAAEVELGPPRRGGEQHPDRELVILVPGDGEVGGRAATGVLSELESGLEGSAVAVVAVSRPAADPVDLHRAGSEALLAANVAEARGQRRLGFEETGAYRLLLPAMSEDPGELHRFHSETIAPIAGYDEQYDTELVRTLETFLDADGNVARTAELLFTHRHTIRYRLDRIRELSSLDVSSTDGRERLSLGLKAMRVLGFSSPGGPGREPGSSGGRVARGEADR